MIGIEGVPEPGQRIDVFEQSLLLPVPGQERNTILFEPRDGSAIERLVARSVELEIGGKTAFKARDVKIDVFITDARLAFACSKYDKGGGWIGGPGALVLNAGSHALAAIRRHGKMMVGQVRYPWIDRVGGSTLTGWRGTHGLYLTGAFAKGRSWRLILGLPKDVSASRAAAEIARRAARHRLAIEPDLERDERSGVEALATAQPLTAAKDKVASHVFPRHWFTNELSARKVPPVAAEAGT